MSRGMDGVVGKCMRGRDGVGMRGMEMERWGPAEWMRKGRWIDKLYRRV